MNVFCPECGSRTLLSPEKWRCSCGAAWEPLELARFDPDLVCQSDPSLWRYHRLYELDFAQPVVRMGTGSTPLLAANLAGREVLLKLEYLAPTASFKDRGMIPRAMRAPRWPPLRRAPA